MNTNETLQQMQQLKFNGMAACYKTQLELPLHQQLEAHELIAQLMQAETLSRGNEKTAYYLKLVCRQHPNRLNATRHATLPNNNWPPYCRDIIYSRVKMC